MEDDVLTIKDLQAGYENKPVLKQVSFCVHPGEFIGLIGPNGAGKSTLLKTLRGMLPVQAGSVLLHGRPVAELTAREFAREAAYLQQQVEVAFGYTAREIAMAGRYPYLRWWQSESREDEAVVDACMEYTGVAGLAAQPMQAMSGGQRQRVLLAKVLAQQTPLLFLDEPATGLDMVYQEEIFRFCRELCAAGKTVLMVAHELSLAARFCSRLLLAAKGGILADGTAEQVLLPEILAKAYDASVEVAKNPVTGHIELFTRTAGDDPHRRALLARILGNTSARECESAV